MFEYNHERAGNKENCAKQRGDEAANRIIDIILLRQACAY